MPVISLIGCRMFEDEITHVISSDTDLNNIEIVKNEDAERLIEKLSAVGVEYNILPFENIPKLSSRESTDEFTLIVYILEFALDAKPELLREKVYDVINKMSDLSDGILLFYGLCGNVLGDVESDFADLDCPVHILRDEHGDIVDDCICASLGKDTYLSSLMGEERGSGTYFLTPMQAAYWKDMLVIAGLTPDPDNIEMTRSVFDYCGYKNVAKIDTGLSYETDFDGKVNEFANSFDLKVVDLSGSPLIAENAYEGMKKEILYKIRSL